MWKNHLRVALRILRRHKGYAFINVAGLAVGIACCIGILLFVQDELSFDRFHPEADHLYRLNKIVSPQEGGEERHAITSGKMGPTLVDDYPEVGQAVRFLPWFDDVLIRRGETSILLADVAFTDANFFEVFGFDLVRGRPTAVLEAPFSIVLTETTARRLFGDENPIGQSITGLDDAEYEVTGIAEDPPPHSHLRFNALISWSTTVPGNGGLAYRWMNNWLTQVHFTYLLLKDAADPDALEAKFPAFMERHFPERAEQYSLFLQPLGDIYLGSASLLHTRGTRVGRRTYVHVFSIVAVLILLIACFNFTNLATARATERVREVGVRKALGAERKQLIRQFLGESFLLVTLSLLIALTLIHLLLPGLNALTGKALRLDLFDNTALWLLLAGLATVATLVSGLYPAFVLSRFRPVNALRSTHQRVLGGMRLRQGLVTLQFATTIALLAGTAVVYQQVRFTQSKDLGFEEEQLLTLPIEETVISDHYEAFKQELLRHPAVVSVAGASHIPGHGTMSFTLRPEGKPGNESWTANVMRLDDADLIETFDMEIVAGRFFDEDRPTDAESGIVINETLAEALGWRNPVGKRMDIEGELSGGRVIGVVRDFHYESLHQEIAPLAMYVAPRHALLTIRFATSDVPSLLSFLQERWEAHESAYPFEYTFLDQAWARLYDSEQRLMRTLGLFAGLAVLVACLGLFGLVAITAQQRTKEIGIRKVLGASVANVVTLLSKDFLKLVLLAFVLSVPVAYVAMTHWLQDFAYRIDLGAGVFVFAGGLALTIALATVSFHSLRAATSDPVESLRYE